MKMKFEIFVDEEYPRTKHSANIQINANINGVEFCSRETIPEEADPVYFDFVWDKIGKTIRQGYIELIAAELSKLMEDENEDK